MAFPIRTGSLGFFGGARVQAVWLAEGRGQRGDGRGQVQAVLPLQGAVLGTVWPLGACQLGGFLCTNLSLKYVPVSFSHTIKSCECLFTALPVCLHTRHR